MKRFLHSKSFFIKSILPILFIMCCQFGFSQVVAVDYGKSYINITKGLNGGTVETGDTLQVRATFVVRCTSGCPAYVDSVAYYDTIRTGTAYIPGSLAVLTNEGKTYKSFTDASNDDCGFISGSNLRINLGFSSADAPATAYRRGRIRNTHKPSFYGSTVIMVASFKIKVTSALGTQINTGGGAISYKPTTSGSPLFVRFPTNTVQVFTNYGICTNTVGANTLGTETNGTFGSGKPRNRSASGNVPSNYTYAMFTTGGPQDYYYGVANNTSTQTNYTTLNTWAKPDNSSPTHRVFNVWDIIGDHTGAASPTLGNPAADTVANSNAGYMVVINAAYRIDTAFKHTVTNLCPNTYYELSMWFRNICSKCGCDSNGKGATNSAGPPYYIPTATGDSSGVKPNLTIQIDGIDYYTTGNMDYNGLWVKKGFTYLTGPAQTSFMMTVRNNAPGGGGNDWALDDIQVATCTPNLTLIPNGNFNVCYGNQVDMSCTVRSYFSNYIQWRWEKSTDDGATWVNTGESGTGSPTLVGGEYQYVCTYPSFLADSSSHGMQYRIRVASTVSNMVDNNCSFTASNTVIVLVDNCQWVLKTEMLSFDGKLVDGLTNLKWITTNEDEGIVYEIERSNDKLHFSKIGTVNGNNSGKGGTYDFVDNVPVTGNVFYRIKIKKQTDSRCSKIIVVTANPQLTIEALTNPFTNRLTFELIAPQDGTASLLLIDMMGRIVKSVDKNVTTGLNNINITELHNLAPGTYTLRMQLGAKIANKRVVKMGQ